MGAMKNLFDGLGFGQTVSIQLDFKRKDDTKVQTASVKTRAGDTETLPLYTNKDDVCGEIDLTPVPGRKVDHLGITLQLVGEVEMTSDTTSQFVCLNRNLAPQGEINSPQQYTFAFDNVELQYDSYNGNNVSVRYFLRVSVIKGYGATMVREFPFWVRNYDIASEASAPIKMEVGIEECLHIEFEYNKARYHLNDVVVGKIYFLLVRVRLKHMELEVRRREVAGSGSSARIDNEALAKYEIMDGAPVRGESVPIRLFLTPYDLTPSYTNVDNKLSVHYLLNLVLVDEEDRRYFKQQEIQLYRQAPAPDGSARTSNALASFQG